MNNVVLATPKAFLIRHRGRAGQVFLEDEHIGKVPDPLEHARALALEAFYEPYPKGEYPTPKFRECGRIIQIEASTE